MAAYVSLGALVMQLLFLAVVLSIVGVTMNRVINRIRASRTESKMKSAAVVSRARAQTRAARQAHA